MPRFSVFAGFLAVVVSFGCSFEPKSGPGGSTNPSGFDAASGVDRPFISGEVGAVTGDACPQNNYTANMLPPDLLIVLDRSGSMNQDSAGTMLTAGDPNTKWALMTAAIKNVVNASETMVNWGLKFFATGTGSSCTVGNGAAVDPMPMTAAMIAAAIDAPANQPATRTPTRAAETSAGMYFAGRTNANPKYILLATDGEPNCAESGSGNVDGPGAIAAVAAVLAMGFPTFVIGIAADAEAGTTLEGMAVAGGVPRAGGNPSYYSVSTTADLQAALTAIQAMTALPCQFQLGGVPSVPSAVTVTVGGMVIPMGEWTFGPGMRSVVFADSSAICTQLKSGAIKDVQIQLPCGVTLIP